MSPNTQKIISSISDNITNLIQQANNNQDCPGFLIVMGNFSINVPPDDQESFWEELDELAGDRDLYFAVNQYNDLVIHTEMYEPENYAD